MPQVGDGLMEGLRAHALCIDQARTDQNMLQCFDSAPVRCPPPNGSAPSCSCEWLPDNGFDGFASAITLLCAAYALVLAAAAALNLRGPNRRFARRPRDRVNLGVFAVEPLRAATAPVASSAAAGGGS